MSDIPIAPLDFTASTASIGGSWSFTGASCVTTIDTYPCRNIACRICDEQLKRENEDICPGCKDKVRAKLIFKYKSTPGRPTIYSKIDNEIDAIREWAMKQEEYANGDTLTISNTDSWIGTSSSTTITGDIQFYTNGTTINTNTTGIVDTPGSVRITDV